MSTYTTSICANCLASYTPKRWDQATCSKRCNKEAYNEAMVRGAEVYALVYRWRFDRRNSNKYLTAICRAASRWRNEDFLRQHRKLPAMSRGQRDNAKAVAKAVLEGAVT